MSHGFWLPGLGFAATGAAFILWAIWPLLRRDRCRCGHDFAAHQHYRRGTDCGLCPEGECGRFRGGRVRALPRQLALGLLEDAAGRAERRSDENDPAQGGTNR